MRVRLKKELTKPLKPDPVLLDSPGFLFPMTYEQQLQTPEWRSKRLEIIERDLWMCQHCMSTRNLQVHHKYYEDDRMAWDYPNIALLTLCDQCHDNVHKYRGPLKRPSELDRALARLVNVAQGMRHYVATHPLPPYQPQDGEEIY